MEKVISNRLYSVLEENELFNINQSGFRKNRGTMDHFICLSEDVRKSLSTRQFTLGVFLDIEKAYDMVWRKGILFKLHKMHIGGKIFNWINNFLHNRKIQVRLGITLSDEFHLDKEVQPVLFYFSLLLIILKLTQILIYLFLWMIQQSGRVAQILNIYLSRMH